MKTSELPRELLWQDMETIDEFFDDPLNKKLYNILRLWLEKGQSSLPLLNEAWYICERIYYEDDPGSLIGDYLDTAKKDLKDMDLVTVVMCLVYSIFKVQKDELIRKHTDKVTGILEMFLERRDCWGCFNQFVEETINNGKMFNSEFRPHRRRGISKQARQDYESKILALEMRNAEVEGQNERLTKRVNQLEDRKPKGRFFSFDQILNYIDDCVEWGDAKPLLQSLKDLTIGNITEEEIKAIRRVEKNYKNRKNGDTVMGDKVEVKRGAGLNKLYLTEENNPADIMRLLQNEK